MFTRTLAAIALLLCLLASPALADGFIVVPPRVPDRPGLRNQPLWVKYHRVSTEIKGRVAVTHIDQVFVNPNPRRLEGTYLFPLPEGAAIDRFSMWVDGAELMAELLSADKARSIYEGIVRRQQDPALLEYMERDLFKARIFPIEAHGEKRVKISYAELLPADNGTVSYRYPLNTEKFSSRPLQDVSVRVTLDAGGPIASVYSPTHPIDVPADLSGAVTVGWEDRDVKPDQDFLLYWRPTDKDIGISAVAHRDPVRDADGTFLLVIAPAGTEAKKPFPKDVVFVMDTSGSMAGQKMEQARGALRYCLNSLNEGDRFGLVPFSTEPRPYRGELTDVGTDAIASALTYVGDLKARGGTAIHDALRVAMDQFPEKDDPARARMVLFVTDGLPTIGVSDVPTILSDAKKSNRNARVFAFGVGDDVNTKLLDQLAIDNRGTRDYVAEKEDIEEKVGNLFAKLAHPAMTDVKLVIEGVDTHSVHPRALPDLFHGGELLVTGRYAKPGGAVIRLSGRVQGEAVEIVEELALPENDTRAAFLPRLWGVRRVGFLLDEIRLNGESAELREEVVRLAKLHGIVTPYTSYLIVEDGAVPPPTTRGPGSDRRFGGGGDRGDGAGGGPPRPSAPAGTRGGFLPEEDSAAEELMDDAERARRTRSADSGRDAVEASKDALELQEGRNGAGKKSDALGRLLRVVSGREFQSVGGIWRQRDIDTEAARTKVTAFSAEWFALLKKHPELKDALQLGAVWLEIDGATYEIVLPKEE